jgi:hypothetical protein
LQGLDARDDQKEPPLPFLPFLLFPPHAVRVSEKRHFPPLRDPPIQPHAMSLAGSLDPNFASHHAGRAIARLMCRRLFYALTLAAAIPPFAS